MQGKFILSWLFLPCLFWLLGFLVLEFPPLFLFGLGAWFHPFLLYLDCIMSTVHRHFIYIRPAKINSSHALVNLVCDFCDLTPIVLIIVETYKL